MRKGATRSARALANSTRRSLSKCARVTGSSDSTNPAPRASPASGSQVAERQVSIGHTEPGPGVPASRCSASTRRSGSVESRTGGPAAVREQGVAQLGAGTDHPFDSGPQLGGGYEVVRVIDR
ncbi:hypothetical protein SALBM135S_06089 [Streptomyces alboniger]